MLVVCAAPPTAQNVFGYAVRFDQGVVLGLDAALAITSVPRSELVVFGRLQGTEGEQGGE